MRTLSNGAIFLLGILFFASCREAPVTERKEPLVYLSTHPVDDKRIAEIEQILQNQNVQK